MVNRFETIQWEELKKFEHVWAGDPVQRGPSQKCLGGGPVKGRARAKTLYKGARLLYEGEGLGPCTVMTDGRTMTENITFLQLSWRTVIT